MKSPWFRAAAFATVAASILSVVSCSPVYPPGGRAAYHADSKDYEVPLEPAPQPQRYGVDPGVGIAGAAAAGLLGYAIDNHRSYDNTYYGLYYLTAPYGRYYGPRYHP